MAQCIKHITWVSDYAGLYTSLRNASPIPQMKLGQRQHGASFYVVHPFYDDHQPRPDGNNQRPTRSHRRQHIGKQ